MSLQIGTYLIKSKSANTLVGRNIKEDMSLLPKSVLLLPKHFPDVDAQWEITKGHSDHTYLLKTRGSHAAEIRHLVFGVLLHEPPATEWKIEAVPQHGKHTFIICKASGEGWVSPEEELEQIHVRHLIVGPSHPPHYPSNQLFEITPYTHLD